MRRVSFLFLALAVVAPSCNVDDAPPGSSLREDFPQQAGDILFAGSSLAERDSYFELSPGAGWRGGGLSVKLPHDAGAPVELRSGAFSIELREQGLTGQARRDGNAVIYAREDGSSFWMMTGNIAEEWLLLPDGVNTQQAPVARWQVTGGELITRGDKVAVLDHGRVRMLAAAPVAYGPEGQRLTVRLETVGDELHLHVQPSAGPVLVDPSWVDYATMVQARGGHASTLLLSGNVLATGGDAFGPPINTTESYDPTTASWSALASMNTPRTGHTATTLNNGQVLVTGGWDGFFPFSSTELLDAGLTSWSGGPFMDDPRALHTATKLTDGNVLVCGGLFGGGGGGGEDEGDGGNGGGPASIIQTGTPPGGGSPVDSCQRYNALLSSFEQSLFMNDGRYLHQAVRLQNGQVLLCGGEGFGTLNSCERYNPISDSLFQTGFMVEPRSMFTMTMMLDGRVLACGGEQFGDGSNVLSSCEIYNPAIGTWTLSAPMATPRAGHTASLLPDGGVFIVGGMDDQFNFLDSSETYDPATNSWLAGSPPITDARNCATATTLINGYILVSGGYNAMGAVTSSMVYAADGGNGTMCAIAGDCGSGNCVQGICCDAACTGLCESCLGANTGGLDGTCAPVTEDTDPDNECGADQGAASCGMTGNCDGSGACKLYPAGTICEAGGCVDSTLTFTDVCDGTGTCIDGGVQECALYSCTDTGCNVACVTSADCSSAAYCDTPTSVCVPKKINGVPAATSAECVSGFAADGVCCDTACDLGVCDACTVATGSATDGVCGLVGGGCDDGNPCTVDICDAQSGCGAVSKLDGSPCEGGVCIAAQCVPDAANSSAASTGSGNGGNGPITPSSGNGGDAESGAGGDGIPSLEGGGFCTAAAAHGDTDASGWLALLGLAGLGLARRRRKN